MSFQVTQLITKRQKKQVKEACDAFNTRTHVGQIKRRRVAGKHVAVEYRVSVPLDKPGSAMSYISTWLLKRYPKDWKPLLTDQDPAHLLLS